MTLPNPKFAPRRNDLPWLRRRRKPPVIAEAAPAAKSAPAVKVAPAAKAAPVKAAPPRTAAAASGPPHGSRGKIDYTRRDRSRPAASSPTPTPQRAPDVTPRSSPRPAPSPEPRPAPRPATRPAPHPEPRPVAASSGGNPLDLSGPAPTAASPAAPPPRRDPAPAAGGGNPLDLSGPSPTPAPADTSLDLGGPPSPPARASASSGGSTSLDLGGSSAPPPSSASSSSTSLDLGGSPAPPSSASSSSTSLDLGGAPAPPPAPSPPPSSSTSLDLGGPAGGSGTGATASRAPRPAPAPARHHVVRRTRRGAATLLEFSAPVVTLDRIQSGVGALTFDAVVGNEVGDLRLGAAWALTDGRTGTVELDAGRKLGPDGRGAVVWAGKEGRFERISLDLRQSRSLARLLLYGFSPSRQTVPWGGTMVVTTFGGDRIDAPIVSAPSPAVLALLSVYNVDGELVVRSEMDPVAGTVRDTCRAFGYDRITWLDDRTPVA